MRQVILSDGFVNVQNISSGAYFIALTKNGALVMVFDADWAWFDLASLSFGTEEFDTRQDAITWAIANLGCIVYECRTTEEWLAKAMYHMQSLSDKDA